MELQTFRRRNCPICENTQVNRLEVGSKIKAEDLDYEQLVPYWNGFFKDKIYFSYCRCPQCELLYAPIFFEEDQLQKLYSQMAPNMDVVPSSALKRTQKEYFDEFARSGLPQNAYVEVGPDVGLFTEHAAKRGQFSKFWLFEPNQLVHKSLEAVVSKNKHEILEDMFGFSVIPDSSVGAVVMIQVLDHLLDPVPTLIELKKKMSPNAKLIFVTHNEQSLLRSIARWKWPAFCLQHPQIYNPKSIAKLLEKSGFNVTKITRSKNYFEIGFLLKHLCWIFGLKVNNLPKILDVTVGLRLGNIITIAEPNNL